MLYRTTLTCTWWWSLFLAVRCSPICEESDVSGMTNLYASMGNSLSSHPVVVCNYCLPHPMPHPPQWDPLKILCLSDCVGIWISSPSGHCLQASQHFKLVITFSKMYLHHLYALVSTMQFLQGSETRELADWQTRLCEGHWLWLCKEGQRSYLDAVWNTWVSGSWDHPFKGKGAGLGSGSCYIYVHVLCAA